VQRVVIRRKFGAMDLAKSKGLRLYDKSGKAVAASELGGKVVALYFSAHWCPPMAPMRLEFTSSLKKFYDALKAAGQPFEIIFVSSDKSPEEGKGYFQGHHGDWLMLDHSQTGSLISGPPWCLVPVISQSLKDSHKDIPSLIVINSAGEAVVVEAWQQVGRGPTVFEEWKKLCNLPKDLRQSEGHSMGGTAPVESPQQMRAARLARFEESSALLSPANVAVPAPAEAAAVVPTTAEASVVAPSTETESVAPSQPQVAAASTVVASFAIDDGDDDTVPLEPAEPEASMPAAPAAETAHAAGSNGKSPTPASNSHSPAPAAKPEHEPTSPESISHEPISPEFHMLEPTSPSPEKVGVHERVHGRTSASTEPDDCCLQALAERTGDGQCKCGHLFHLFADDSLFCCKCGEKRDRGTSSDVREPMQKKARGAEFVHTDYKDQLQQLLDMGIPDGDNTRAVLNRAHGNVELALNSLL